MQQFKSKNWLNDFLARRGLREPDGRHLYSYHATPEEFLALEKGLRQNVATITRLGIQNPFNFWQNAPEFNAAFVLYASFCWQQRYAGTKWTYDVIIQGLNIQSISVTERQNIISNGLEFWGLGKNDKGLTYLGAIARESGLPQKLLSEDRSSVGRILHSVLREALRTNMDGDIIVTWVASLQQLLPQSYRNENINTLLADSINAILAIKKTLNAKTLETALQELDERMPDWRSRFPLPLYDETACEIVNNLLEEAAVAQTTPSGRPISATRRLVKNSTQQWLLQACIDIPTRLEANLGEEKPRLLSIHMAVGATAFEAILKKYADNNFYFLPQKRGFLFSGADASEEILVRYTTQSGFHETHVCPGGMELDAELPWIFEGEQYDYRFRQQGGGSVRGNVAYVALSAGWQAENAEEVGKLDGTDRSIHRITRSSILRNDDLVFHVKIAALNTEEYGWSRNNRFWEAEMLKPALAFRGLPKVVNHDGNTLKIARGELLEKRPGAKRFVPLEAATMQAGVTSIWFTASDGASLRNDILLLPPEASVRLEVTPEGYGLICLEGWRAADAAIEQMSEGIEAKLRRLEDRLEIVLKILPGYVPPPTVDLWVYWKNNTQAAKIRLPLPQQGARIFNSSKQEIPPKRQLCVSFLHGLRLFCFSKGVRHAVLRLSIRNGKILDYPLVTHNNFTIINLMEWQNALLEMLAMESGIDAHVSLAILFDELQIASWNVKRYNAYLISDNHQAILSLPEYAARPPQGYALKALLLEHPELPPIPITETLLSDNAPAGKWEIAQQLSKAGSWLLFDDTPGTSMRPLLWFVDGQDDLTRNRLQAAIGGKDRESRLRAFSACVSLLVQSLDLPEWTTLLALFQHITNLPLSTLEIWQALLQSPLIMAIIALHPGISFETIISRISTELPFLWSLISKSNWHTASQIVKDYLCKIIPGTMGISFWENHMNTRMEELGAYCPAINALLRVAISLPSDEPSLGSIRAYYTTDQVNNLLFKDENSDMQKLLRRHAEEIWPTELTSFVNKKCHDTPLKTYLPFDNNLKNGVIGLPILLAIQAFVSRPVFFHVPANEDAIFNIRKHFHFDNEWFEQAANLTTFRCTAENINIGE